MPSFPDLVQPLVGPVAQLRLATERDIPEILIAHQEDPHLYVSLGLAQPPSGAELGRRVEREAAERQARGGAWLTILGQGSDECRGQVDVHRVEAEHLRAELGIWVAPRQRGQGLGTGALALAGRWLLEVCGMMRVELLTEPDNDALTGAATAAGFVAEGVLRSYLRERGRRVDARVLSLIPSDLGEAR